MPRIPSRRLDDAIWRLACIVVWVWMVNKLGTVLA
jgi:hypothetical protein